MKRGAISLLVASGAFLARTVPYAFLFLVSRCLGAIWYWLIPVRNTVACDNIAHALKLSPAASKKLTRRMYNHLCLSVLELFRYGTQRGLKLPYVVEGEEHLRKLMDSGQGAFLLTAHLGNWEVLARYGEELPGPVRIVRKKLSISFWHELWLELRAGGPKQISTDKTAVGLTRFVRKGGMVGMVLDQHATEASAIRLPFFGRKASTSTGMVRLARMLQAPIVPIFSYRRSGLHMIKIGKPFLIERTMSRSCDVANGVRVCLRHIETAIEESPEQWLWIHRRWKPDPKVPS
ncbi:MAG: lysophospholipid acyltransferase family protein [Myxococcota bacterium]|nr:lysophospholipid acyltransferase family protein [Myxococcota bacterium]